MECDFLKRVSEILRLGEGFAKVWQLRIYITQNRCTVLSKEVIKLGNEEGKSKLRKKLAIE